MSQADLDVWLQTLHMAMSQKSNDIVFTGRGMLRSLGRKGTGKRDLDWLSESISKLAANLVTVENKTLGVRYRGPLITRSLDVHDGARYVVGIDPVIANYFAEGFTRMHWETRLALNGDLTKWLHGYVCSHEATYRNPSKIGLVKLKELCGSEGKALRNFRLAVRKSMAQLVDNGVVATWSLDEDVLSFARSKKRAEMITAHVEHGRQNILPSP